MSLRFLLKYFRCEGNNFHKLFSTQLSGNGAEDTGADRLVGVVDDNPGIVVEADVRAIRTSQFLGRSNNDNLYNIAFFTLEFGRASRTEATMMSPIPAYLRLEPPSTLMQNSFFAPELSATSNIDCICIITQYPYLKRCIIH